MMPICVFLAFVLSGLLGYWAGYQLSTLLCGLMLSEGWLSGSIVALLSFGGALLTALWGTRGMIYLFEKKRIDKEAAKAKLRAVKPTKARFPSR